MTASNMDTWSHRGRAAWASWILTQTQLIPVLREQTPFCWLWLFQREINGESAWIKGLCLNSSRMANSIIIPDLILHVLRVANSGQIEITINFFLKQKNYWESQSSKMHEKDFWDSSAGKGNCHQAWQSEFDPQDPHGRRRKPVLKFVLWPPYIGQSTCTQINKCDF